MLKIKLARFGKKNQPHFRIVLNEAKTKRDGKYTAILGHYAPTSTPKILDLDLELYKEWLTKGAQPTPTVAGLAKRLESGNPFPPKKPSLSKKAKAKATAAALEAAKPVEAPVEEPTPVVEAVEVTTEKTQA